MTLTFPNVPDAPGVPTLGREPGQDNTPPPFLEQDSVPEFGQSTYPLWGIFKDGNSVVTAESVIALEYKQDWVISTYPVEEGAFQSYNKVDTPFAARVRFSTGGTEVDRAELLRSISAIADTTELYDLITPEVSYTGVNVVHFDYRRTSYQGVGLLQVDVWVEQVRETGSSAFSATKSPSGATPVDDGTVQSLNPTQDDTDQIEEKFQQDSVF